MHIHSPIFYVCLRWLAAVFMLCSWSGSANAHLMAAQKGTLHLQGKRVYTVVAIPVSAFASLDPAGTGHADDASLEQQRSPVKAAFSKGFHLGKPGEGRLLDVMLTLSPAHDAGTGSDQVVVMAVTEFDSPPNTLPLTMTLFGTAKNQQEYKFVASRTRADGTEENITSVLTPQLNSVLLFSSNWGLVQHFIALGLQHILTGFDHLLFLATVLLIQINTRRWLALLTSFTVAHGCTFTLASFGWLAFPAGLVEPLIAASVLLAAAARLRGLQLRAPPEIHFSRSRCVIFVLSRSFIPHKLSPSARKCLAIIAKIKFPGVPLTITLEMLVVFICGLIHGLGFALAFGELGLDAASPVWSILGFNLGIELGQLIVAATLLLVIFTGRRMFANTHSALVTKIASYSIFLSATLWFAQQLIFTH